MNNKKKTEGNDKVIKTIESNGAICYKLNNKLHKEDGPAVEYLDGTKEWYKNGLRHREDGPAVEDSEGDKEWYLNGKAHREDGPAVEWLDGDKEWWLNDNLYGINEDFTNESWVRFVKTLIFS